MEGYTSNTFLISTAFLGVLKRMAAESKSKSNKNKDIMNIIDLLLSSWLPSTITTSHTFHIAVLHFIVSRGRKR